MVKPTIFFLFLLYTARLTDIYFRLYQIKPCITRHDNFPVKNTVHNPLVKSNCEYGLFSTPHYNKILYIHPHKGTIRDYSSRLPFCSGIPKTQAKKCKAYSKPHFTMNVSTCVYVSIQNKRGEKVKGWYDKLLAQCL